MNTKWKDQFHFTRSERNGVLLLSMLILLVFVLPHVYSLFVQPKSVDFSEFETVLNEFNDAKELAEAETEYGKTSSSSFYNTAKTTTSDSPAKLFTFNPNTATSEELADLGLSSKTANILIKYRTKGGKFYKKEDLKKIYGLKAEDYERLEAYIEIPQQEKSKSQTPNSKKQNADIATTGQIALFDFDPNTASIDDFVQLGLSPKTARTIEKYRQKGGTFYKKEDFKKIYGLKAADYERLEAYIDIPQQKKSKFQTPNSKKQNADIATTGQIALFDFDPNTASIDDFVQLGLSPKTAATIVKYREKGGTFYKKEDFKKIYSLKDSDFSRLEPHINIVPKKVNFKEDKFQNRKAKQVSIDVNTASEEDWQQLRGIGPSYSTRIVEFRESLGGFHSIKQVNEVYGLPDSTFQAILPQLQFNSTPIRKLNINTATADELKAHPYLKWKQANVIINYREQHGAFESVDDLGKVKVISAETLAKLKPYLRVE